MSLVQQFDEDLGLALSTLAANDVIGVDSKIDASREQGFHLVQSRWSGSFTGKQSAEGPIAFGVALNLGDAEIEAILEADPQSPHDDDARGQGNYIKQLGMMPIGETAGHLFNGVPFVDIKPKWSISEGQPMKFWFYNMGGSGLTDGVVVNLFGEHLGRWLND